MLVALILGGPGAAVAQEAGSPPGEGGTPKEPIVPREIDPLKDPMGLLEQLEQRRHEMDERSRWLELREEEMQRLEEKLAKRIEALEQLREAIKDDLAKEKEVDTGNVARLSKIYAKMKPKVAAVQIQELDNEMAVKVFKMMPEKSAAKILTYMDNKRAVALAEDLGIPISQKRGFNQ